MRTIIFVLLSLTVICAATPSTPQPRPEQHWIARHESLRLNTANNPSIPIIFHGDSITDWWTIFGITTFYRYYAPLGVANYGISGDRTEHVLWRILNGEIQGLNPKLVVLMIGTNNLATDGSEAIADGILTIVRTLHQQLPNTKILLLGVLPRNGVANFDRIVAINERISHIQNGRDIFYLDMFDFRGDVWGVVPTNLFFDGLHLGATGYQLWADTMNPLFNKLYPSSTFRSTTKAKLNIYQSLKSRIQNIMRYLGL